MYVLIVLWIFVLLIGVVMIFKGFGESPEDRESPLWDDFSNDNK